MSGPAPEHEPPCSLSSETCDTGHLKSSADPDPAATQDTAGTVSDCPAPQPSPCVGGHELIGEIARGGMGVVYKARQTTLDRIVALKMILAGPHADQEQLARFKIEAEAIARLQHPHIVQIYEIGECDRLPYFSLEFCAGGSLDQRLRRERLGHKEAAGLVETLARAIHAAHAKGVIHRDLKPANILFTEEGAPKITDFGLARKLDDEGRTVSGAVMGTPGYMAPEQARGERAKIGPASDTYALGAILYQCLTGKAPFTGETPWEVIQKVLTSEPVSIAQIQPTIPPDLETICLKAMAKEADQRYESALALAQDLERFLADEPILARRESTVRKVWRKVRRNRPLVLSALLILLTVVFAILRIRTADDTAELAKWEARLQHPELSEQYLREMEGALADLESRDPKQAGQNRKRLYSKLSGKVHELFREQIDPFEKRRQIQAAISLLDGRDKGLAANLKKEYARERDWITVVALKGGESTGIDSAFGPGAAQPQVRDFARGASQDLPFPLRALSQKSCVGNAEVSAVYADPYWRATSKLGVCLCTEDGLEQYVFTLQVAPPQTFTGARKENGFATIRIQKDGQTLRERIVAAKHLPDGSLKLEACLEDQWVSFRLDDRPGLSLSVRSPFLPDSRTRRRLCALWPEGTRLQQIVARQQLPALSRPPMEEGDKLFRLGEHERALDFYRNRVTLDTAELHRERRVKEALCCLELGQYPEAIAALKALSQGTRDYWTSVVQAHLLLAYARRGKAEEVDNLLEMHLRQSPDRLQAITEVMSDEQLRELWELFFTKQGAVLALQSNQSRTPLLELLVRDMDRSRSHPRDRGLVKMALYYVYTQSRRHQKAIEVLQQLVENDPAASCSLQEIHLNPIPVLSWALRNNGEPEKALKFINRYLVPSDTLPDHSPLAGLLTERRRLYLLVERARIHVALGDWAGAEKDLQQVLQTEKGLLDRNELELDDISWPEHAVVRLMLGFVYAQRGDHKRAVTFWKESLFKKYMHERKSLRRIPGPMRELKSAEWCLYGLLAGSLSNDLTKADLITLLSELVPLFDKLPLRFAPGDGIIFPMSYWRRIWRTPEGLRLAEAVLFQQMSVTECVRRIIHLHAVEGIYQEGFENKVTADQKKLIRKLVRETCDVYLSGKIKPPLIAKDLWGLLYTWTNGLGFGLLPLKAWQGGRSRVLPRLRGPLSYIFGRRYLKLKKPSLAKGLFLEALEDSAGNPLLSRLVRLELDKFEAGP